MSNSGLKVVFVTGRFEQPMTGGEKYNFNIIHYLQENGAEVQILTLGGAPRSVSGTSLLNHLFCNLWWWPAFLSRNVRGTIFLLASYTHSRMFLPVLILSLFRRSRLVAVCHHLAYHDLASGFRRVIDRPLEAVFLRLMDRVITISESACQELVTLGVAADRIAIITPGFDQPLELLQHKHRAEISKMAFQVLFVGTCVPRKGLIYLLQAVRLLGEQCNICVHVVGDIEDDPAYYRSLVDFVDEEGLQDKVFFHGRISGLELDDLYAKADVFVLPSLWEGYGIALLEAMAHGLPIIATSVGAIPELVRHGENGILVPPRDAEALADALCLLKRDMALRARIGETGRRMVDQSQSWEEVGGRFHRVLIDVA